MKKSVNLIVVLCVSAVCCIALSCRQQQQVNLDPAGFVDPPSSNYIHAWWHWLDNAITRDGITKDLEAMKEQGISAATILNVGLFEERDLGVPQVKFGTEEWYQMFEWALAEANRLGMTLGVHNCDGWSSSGGPWIDPASSMKRCVWSRSVVEGGKKVEIRLQEPAGNYDFFKDICVVAVPASTGVNSFQKAAPEIKVNTAPDKTILYDANPFSCVEIRNGSIIDISFGNDFQMSSLAIHPRVEFAWVGLDEITFKFELKVSNDGKTYKSVQEFPGPALNRTTVIEAGQLSSKYFRLEFKDLTGVGVFDISEIELLGENEEPSYHTVIPFHLEKTGTTKAHKPDDFQVAGEEKKFSVPSGSVVDLTGKMDQEGILRWEAPEGKWELFRIGYTTTGAQNAPATNAGRGLECDKMDTAALNLHFRSFPSKLVRHAGKYTGNTFEYLFIDSWECGYQNWTGNFASEFEKRRQYSIINWMPVICGITIDDPLATESFLHDFQLTIAELIEENYYHHFHRLCMQNGLKSHAEVIYGGTGYPPLDILRSNSHIDVPMFEFWATPDRETGLISYQPVEKTAFPMPAHAGALYGKNVVPAEAYTGYANYSECPWDLKLFGDNAFCSGINLMVLHSYVHQPFEKKPGITLGQFGQSFNRHNPWWDFASQWFTYHARVQNILQQGVTVADILCFAGDRFYLDPENQSNHKLPAGYSIQLCNYDILKNHCRVEDGKLRLDNGLSYDILLLPDDVYMNPGTLKRIEELVKSGAVVTGPRPTRVPGNLNHNENDEILNEISGKVWGEAGTGEIHENKYGKGHVYSGINLMDIIDILGIQPDLSYTESSGGKLIYIHKKVGSDDVYFIVNQEDRVCEHECVFRLRGKYPEIWNPQYGTICSLNDYSESDGRTVVKLRFQPRESLFIVFRDELSSDIPVYSEPEQKYIPEDLKGTLEFEGLPGKKPVEINALKSWITFSDPEIKYYSGKARYSLKFDLPAELINRKSLYLCVDSIKTPYEISINDHLAGCSAFPGHRFEVSSLVKEKDNNVVIRIANPYRNRIIGDFAQYGALKDLWTTSPVRSLPGKDHPLLESGILGPLTFYY
ncbi:MAG: hypothetical protein GYA41_10680 [Bacteroidales bacterium]|nr:hypothetical protein [Bacteroidales bacterium]